MCTTTGSVGSLALPLKVGLVFFDGVVGPFSVTVGDAVLIVNETRGSLLPAALPRELAWLA